MKLTKRRIQSGALVATIELDPHGRLHSVTLPKRIPYGMDATALASVIAELGKFELVQDASPFRAKAWKIMREIPWGSAMTYGELAAAAGSPGASRAAGQACAKNRLPLVIPCHRVLAENGLGGFAFGLPWKAKLLELESEQCPVT